MASDDNYLKFLNKANTQSGTGQASAAAERSHQKITLKATDDASKIPASINSVVKDAFYVSDADEPFEAVSLPYTGSGDLPDDEEILALLHHPSPSSASVEILDPVDWDKNGQYTKLIDAVTAVGKGNDVRVYRIALDGGARVMYYLVTKKGEEGKDARLVGVRALAVES